MVVGDIPAVAELCKHTGHTSYPGCRICCVFGERVQRKGGIYFCNIDDKNIFKEYPVRTVDDYKTIAKASSTTNDDTY
jgi:hypothetical protein